MPRTAAVVSPGGPWGSTTDQTTGPRRPEGQAGLAQAVGDQAQDHLDGAADGGQHRQREGQAAMKPLKPKKRLSLASGMIMA